MLAQLGDFLWSRIIIYLITGAGIYLMFKTKFVIFTKAGEICRETLGSLFVGKRSGQGISPFAAMSAALSGTMGTGNIIGVGVAIASGGAGAIFWMFLSAFLCMVIKYAETALAVYYREDGGAAGGMRGGPMYYIKNGLPNMKPLAYVYCICTIAASVGVGNISQAGAISVSLESAFGAHPFITGIVTMLACSLIVFGSVKRLTSFTSMLVPFMTCFYTIGIILLLFVNRANIPSAFGMIADGAFDFTAAGGGVLGFMSAAAVRHGVAKGVFTNEAGLGSASIAHATADNIPHRQGYWGIFEVFTDTVIMCTLTGIAIISSNTYQNAAFVSGENLTADAFCEVFGAAGGAFIAISVVLFAVGAIVSWNYYGAKCCEFICGAKSVKLIYNILFCTLITAGAVIPMNTIFDIADILNAFMAVPNITAVVLLFKNVKSEMSID